MLFLENKPLDKLVVISVVSNPVRYESRYDLYRDFSARMDEAQVKHITVELAYGQRPHEVTDGNNPLHVQLRTAHELWHKENMINVGIQHATRHFPNATAYAWIDADIQFIRRDWALETWHALQHHDFVQCFSDAIDLGPDFQPIQYHKGFVWCYTTGQPFKSQYGPFWHPGFAWAARRSAIDKLGGLLDIGVLGASDHHMALALVGKAKWSLPGKIHPNYEKAVYAWESKAEEYIKRNIGYVPGTILHFWHGKKKDRRYIERWEIITENQFDPEADLIRDSQGIYQLTDKKIVMRDQIRQYFRQRNEDSIDLE